ncbi:MAG: hypothetical protein ACRDA5_03600 [Clostridium sp.]
MGIIQVQILILVTIVLSAIIGGKKGGIIAGTVWFATTIIMMYSNIFVGIQLITVGFSYQMALIIGIGRDYYIKRKAMKAVSK